MQTIKSSTSAAPGKQANKSKYLNSDSNGDTPSSGPTREEIASLAYKLYLESGSQEGRDLENWVQAEQILRQQNGNREQFKAGRSPENITEGSRQQF